MVKGNFQLAEWFPINLSILRNIYETIFFMIVLTRIQFRLLYICTVPLKKGKYQQTVVRKPLFSLRFYWNYWQCGRLLISIHHGDITVIKIRIQSTKLKKNFPILPRERAYLFIQACFQVDFIWFQHKLFAHFDGRLFAELRRCVHDFPNG